MLVEDCFENIDDDLINARVAFEEGYFEKAAKFLQNIACEAALAAKLSKEKSK